MRKLFLLPVLFFLVLSSCKDEADDAAPPSVTEQIKGEWVLNEHNFRSYDASNNLLHESVNTLNYPISFDGDKVTLTLEQNIKESRPYTVEKRGDGYVILSHITAQYEYEIEAIDENKMKWLREEANSFYYVDATPTPQPAAKKITVIEFTRVK